MDPPEGVPRPLPSAQATSVSGMLGRLQGAQSLIFSVHFHPVAALFSLALFCPPVLSFLSAIKFLRLQRNVLECSFTRASHSHFTDAAVCHHLVLPPAHLLSLALLTLDPRGCWSPEWERGGHQAPPSAWGRRVSASLPAANLAQQPLLALPGFRRRPRCPCAPPAPTLLFSTSYPGREVPRMHFSPMRGQCLHDHPGLQPRPSGPDSSPPPRSPLFSPPASPALWAPEVLLVPAGIEMPHCQSPVPISSRPLGRCDGQCHLTPPASSPGSEPAPYLLVVPPAAAIRPMLQCHPPPQGTQGWEMRIPHHLDRPQGPEQRQHKQAGSR